VIKIEEEKIMEKEREKSRAKFCLFYKRYFYRKTQSKTPAFFLSYFSILFSPAKRKTLFM